jgi:hypothetical protein
VANSSGILIGVLGGSGSISGADQLLAAANQASAARDTGADTATALLTEQIEQLRAANQAQAETVADNTQAVADNTATQSTTGGTLQTVSNAISTSAARDTGADNATALLTEQLEQLRAGNQAQAGIVADNNATTQSTTGGTLQTVTNAISTGADNATALLTEQIEQLRAANQVQAGIVADNTKAVANNTATQSTTGGTLQTVTNAISKVNGNSLSISPLISGLVKLFGGGGDSATPAPLMTYTPPEPVRFEGQVSRSANTTDWSGSEGARSGTPVVSSAPQITVQVNAMDGQSFLDHSQEIAMAVREAMLNSHSLNDVVSDL